MRAGQASAASAGPAQAGPSRWQVADGSLEALKWVGLVFMAGDHVNKYLLDGGSAPLFALGRLVMPIFGFVLMFNLARPQARSTGLHARVMKRLALFGGLSAPAFAYLTGWWPANILFTLLLATVVASLWERGGRGRRALATMTFLLCGAFVEFWWPALLYCLGAWAFVRRPTAVRLLVWITATASLALVNGNFAALAALPLIWGAAQVDLSVPRCGMTFYAFYPGHLTLLALCLAAR